MRRVLQIFCWVLLIWVNFSCSTGSRNSNLSGGNSNSSESAPLAEREISRAVHHKVNDPYGGIAQVNSPIIQVSRNKTYSISVSFGTASDSADPRQCQHVQIYSRSASDDTNCLTDQCWSLLASFSNCKEKRTESFIAQSTEWLITAWPLDISSNKSYELKKTPDNKGMEFIFDLPQGKLAISIQEN